MTKPKRVALLLTDILMLLAGMLALMLFIAVTLMLSETPGWPQIPSPEQMRAITDVALLRSRAADAYEKLGISLRW